MVAGNTFDEAFSKWGSALRKYHGKSVDGIQRDVARKYLGYWTDNGAYYYYSSNLGLPMGFAPKPEIFLYSVDIYDCAVLHHNDI